MPNKRNSFRLWVVLILLAGVIGAVVLVRQASKERTERQNDYEIISNLVKHGDIPAFDIMAPHASPPTTLTIGGDAFQNVRGQYPHYIYLEEIHSILFSTSKPPASAVIIHIFNLRTKQLQSFEVGSTSFGNGVGAKYHPDQVRVSRRWGATLIYADTRVPPDSKQRTTINLTSGLVESVRYLDLNDRPYPAKDKK